MLAMWFHAAAITCAQLDPPALCSFALSGHCLYLTLPQSTTATPYRLSPELFMGSRYSFFRNVFIKAISFDSKANNTRKAIFRTL
jgi:hypothetical protein